MAYNEQITRGQAQALMPEEVADAIITGVTQQSAALQLFPHTEMSRAQVRIPVISALPTAYWVQGDTGLKQTSHMEWANKYLNAEEVAVIVPVPEAVLDDANYDLWSVVEPLAVEAIGRALDAAIFLGINKPASWPTDISTAAAAAGNAVARGTHTVVQGGVAQDVSDMMAAVEDDGYDVNGFTAPRLYKGLLRSQRDSLGQRLLDVNPAGTEINGDPMVYSMRGLWPTVTGAPDLIGGDFSQGILGVRKDISWKILTEAVIQDNTGAIVYNLAQQDMVAMRMYARFAFQVPNPINRQKPTDANRYPFGILTRP